MDSERLHMTAAGALKLTIIGKRFTLTPMPSHIDADCSEPTCSGRASHRLFSRTIASTRLLCDRHTLSWAAAHGRSVTTAPHEAQPAAV